MDWYPLWNSLRIAAISTVVIFFAGIFAASGGRFAKGAILSVRMAPLYPPRSARGCYTVAALRFPRLFGRANRAASSKPARFIRHWRRFAGFP